MTQNPSKELVLSGAAERPGSTQAKRITKMVGAAAISLGMVGTFAMPAYAVSTEIEGADGFKLSAQQVQSLTTSESAGVTEAVQDPTAEVGAEVLEEERKEKAAEEAAAQKAEEAAAAEEEAAPAETAAPAAPAAPAGADIPPGAGAQGIVDASLAQLGAIQDCTVLLEVALRAIGIPAGDLGTQIGEYTSIGGTLVTGGDYAPGDVLIWPGRHVAVYIGNGQAVHSGYGGNQTVIAGAFIDGPPGGVVRF